MGLPGLKYEVAKLIKNKYRVRKCLYEAHVDDTEQAYEVNSDTDIESLAPKLTYPVMVKPCDGSGSRGTSRVDKSEDLKKACTYAMNGSITHRAEIETFIKTRIADLEANENTPDNELKGCTPEERWSKGDSWAIMRTGRKTALKVCKSEEEANALLKELGGDSIEFRKGEDVRCESYCNVCKWCPYYQKQKVDNK
jgi:formate-dependent phosphoribosylglycinamide formyltransferase (GAR transformylase)